MYEGQKQQEILAFVYNTLIGWGEYIGREGEL